MCHLPQNATRCQQRKMCANKVTVLATDSKKVADAKADVSKYGYRLAITGKTLIAIGALGVAASLFQAFGARHIVHKILSHHDGHHPHPYPGPHPGPHPGPQPPHPTPPPHHRGLSHHGGGGNFPPHDGGQHDFPDVMTRTEFALIDNFRIMAVFMISAFIAISITGCRALRAVKKGDSKFSDLVWKKTLFRIGWVVAMSAVIHHFAKDCKNLLEGNRNEERPEHY